MGQSAADRMAEVLGVVKPAFKEKAGERRILVDDQVHVSKEAADQALAEKRRGMDRLLEEASEEEEPKLPTLLSPEFHPIQVDPTAGETWEQVEDRIVREMEKHLGRVLTVEERKRVAQQTSEQVAGELLPALRTANGEELDQVAGVDEIMTLTPEEEVAKREMLRQQAEYQRELQRVKRAAKVRRARAKAGFTAGLLGLGDEHEYDWADHIQIDQRPAAEIKREIADDREIDDLRGGESIEDLFGKI